MSAHHHETLRGGDKCSFVLPRHHALTLTAASERSSVAVLAFRHGRTSERYNMPDTLKAQHIARLTAGFVLYSDMGRILCSVTQDTVGWHDPIGGTLSAAQVKAKYGEKSYQEHRNGWTQSAREGLLLELAKYSMGPRDITPTLNLFSKVQVDEAGGMHYVPGNSRAGDAVELRAEMDVLILLAANHHPMEPGTVYAPKPVKLTVKRVAAPAADDPCRLSRPENGRGFILTERYAQ